MISSLHNSTLDSMESQFNINNRSDLEYMAGLMELSEHVTFDGFMVFDEHRTDKIIFWPKTTIIKSASAPIPMSTTAGMVGNYIICKYGMNFMIIPPTVSIFILSNPLYRIIDSNDEAKIRKIHKEIGNGILLYNDNTKFSRKPTDDITAEIATSICDVVRMYFGEKIQELYFKEFLRIMGDE